VTQTAIQCLAHSATSDEALLGSNLILRISMRYIH